MSGTPCFETTASACAIFKSTEHVAEAWDFMMYLCDPANALDLYTSGLWMPIMQKWYDDKELCKKWADSETTSHTPGFEYCAVNYAQYNYKLAPESSIIGWSKLDAIIESQLDTVWLGEMTAADALAEIEKPVNALVSGTITFR